MTNGRSISKEFFTELVESFEAINFVKALYTAIYEALSEDVVISLNKTISDVYETVWDEIHSLYNEVGVMSRPSPEHLAATSILSSYEEVAGKIDNAMNMHYHLVEITKLIVLGNDCDVTEMNQKSLALILSKLS